MFIDYRMKLNEFLNVKNEFKAVDHINNVDLNSFVEYVEPETEIEKKIARVFQSVLNLQSVGVYDDFFENGGHSLAALKLTAGIFLEFNLELSLKEVIENSTIKGIAELLESKQQEAIKVIISADHELNAPFPLTPIQLSYLLGRETQFELGGISTQSYQEFVATLDITKFNNAFNQLIKRHPMLRVVIEEDGQQRILPGDLQFNIVVEDKFDDSSQLDTYIEEKRKTLSHRIFQSNVWPLFDLQAIHIGDNEYYFFFGIDTIIADAQSKIILFQDLIKLYNGIKLPPVKFNFRDYILSLESLKQGDRYLKDKAFWMEKLLDFPDAPTLPLNEIKDNNEPPSFEKLTHKLAPEQWVGLQQVASNQQVSPTALLCTIFSTVLASYCNQKKFSINLTVFNRFPFHADIEQIVGDFTSLLLLDVQIEDFDVMSAAKKVNDNLLDALDHRLYDGVEFIRELARHKGNMHGAIMPVIFTSALYGQVSDVKLELQLKIGNKYRINQSSQVLLDCIISDAGDGLLLQWNYVKQKFDQKVIQDMFDDYIEIVNSILDNKFKAEFPFLNSTQTVLYEKLNNTKQPIPAEILIDLFERARLKYPDNVAVQDGDKFLSYSVLEEKACKVANYLYSNGVVKGDRVGIYSYRSAASIICILGILKIGATFVPIDYDSPEDRISYIRDNCACKLILDKDLFNIAMDREEDTFYSIPVEPSDLAYIIYTSGSTGRPKGVAISNAAACNTVLDINAKFKVGENDRILGISALTFDLSIYDIFGALSVGAAIVLIDDITDTEDIVRCLQEEKITIWNSVPAVMEMAVDFIEQKTTKTSKEKVSLGDRTLPLFWAPSIQWYEKEGKIFIEGQLCPDITGKMFPSLYFLTQQGINQDDLINTFSVLNKDEVKNVIDLFVEEKVLIRTIQSPSQLFASQAKIVKQLPDLAKDAAFLYQYKNDVVNRDYLIDSQAVMSIEECDLPKIIQDRRTSRTFNVNAIPNQVFAKWISVFKQEAREEGIGYHYASAGGLYPIDIYLYIKPGRVIGLEAGYYYYHPQKHVLKLLHATNELLQDYHYPSNKNIFETSAFTVFMVYNARLSMPKYGGRGYYMAVLEAGIMVGTMGINGEAVGLGLCSIADVQFDNLRHLLQLENDTVLLHTAEIGLKIDYELSAVNELEMAVTVPIKIDSKLSQFSLRTIMMSGDWIPVGLPARIKNIFATADIISLGGATEVSIWSIYYPINPNLTYVKSIPYGIPLANQQFYVLNTFGQLCLPGVHGELYIGGSGLALEYIGDAEKTVQSFIIHPNLGRIYKTGDMGFFNSDAGYIEFLGRVDTQVKIRGFRIELGEIESVMMKSGLVSQAVVIATQGGHARQLVGYIVSNGYYKSESMVAYLRSQLPDYMVPVQLIQLDRIPLTGNGKVDKKSLPAYDVISENTTPYVAPGNFVEQKLVDIWQELLNKEHIGIHDNFFALGGHSLHITRLSGLVFNILGVKLVLREIYENPTIEKLSLGISQLKQEAGDINFPLEKVVETGGGKDLLAKELSDFQRLFDNDILVKPELLVQQPHYEVMHNQRKEFIRYGIVGKYGYNVSTYMVFNDLDKGLLFKVLEVVFQRHESLRTVFLLVNGTVQQRVLDAMPPYFEIKSVDLRMEDQKQAAVELYNKTAAMTFDFEKGPLCDFKIIDYDNQRSALVFAIHHVIADVNSIRILEREIRSLYEAFSKGGPNPLSDLKYQYKEYSRWVNRFLEGNKQLDSRAFYEKRIYESLAANRLYREKLGLHPDGAAADRETSYKKELLVDLKRTLKKEDVNEIADIAYGKIVNLIPRPGNIYKRFITEPLLSKLKRLALNLDSSLTMVMFSSFAILYSSLQKEKNVRMFVPISTREFEEFEEIVGWLMSEIIVSVDIDLSAPLRTLVQELNQSFFETSAHRFYPYERLMADFDMPLYKLAPVLINYIKNTDRQLDDFQSVHKNGGSGHFDLHCVFFEYGNCMALQINYNSQIYTEAQMDHVFNNYLTILERMTNNHDISISQLIEL